MPDRTLKTISATQTAALWNASPYVTRWMLWHHFARWMDIDAEESARMSWGKKLQPLIIEQAAADLKLEVHPNADDTYHRRGLIGCTRDATIVCPDRGPGALETKCVFDYRTWMTDWLGGKSPPRCHEIQLQTQMAVGDEDGDPYGWGIIAAWVAGNIYYFERGEAKGFRKILTEDAAQFFADVREGREPDPFGVPIELPWLAEMFPVALGETLDLSGAEPSLSELAVQYRDAKEQEAGGAKAAEPLRAKLLALAKTAENVILPDGVRMRIRPHGKGKRISVFVPSEVTNDWLMAG